MTKITGRTVLVTGGNRGIGRALVEEALHRGAHRVYASTRGTWMHSDERVTPLALDVTDRRRSGQQPARSSRLTSWSTTPALPFTTT